MKRQGTGRYSRLGPLLLCALLISDVAAFGVDTPRPGEIAPPFTLPSQNGAPVSLKGYRGHWVILFFYGSEINADVTLEARNFQRDLAKYSPYRAAVIGVGTASVDTNRAWARRDGLSLPLLFDPDHKVAGSYGVPAIASNSVAEGGLYFVIIDPDGRVRLPGVVTDDADGESGHVLACLQYFRDLAARGSP